MSDFAFGDKVYLDPWCHTHGIREAVVVEVKEGTLIVYLSGGPTGRTLSVFQGRVTKDLDTAKGRVLRHWKDYVEEQIRQRDDIQEEIDYVNARIAEVEGPSER